jgi:hypothetical protein
MSARVFDVDGREAGLFRSHVLQRADHGAKLRGQRFVGQLAAGCLGHAEVDHLGHWLAVVECHQDVRRLEVAVDDALGMGVLDCLADGDEQL